MACATPRVVRRRPLTEPPAPGSSSSAPGRRSAPARGGSRFAPWRTLAGTRRQLSSAAGCGAASSRPSRSRRRSVAWYPPAGARTRTCGSWPATMRPAAAPPSAAPALRGPTSPMPSPPPVRSPASTTQSRSGAVASSTAASIQSRIWTCCATRAWTSSSASTRLPRCTRSRRSTPATRFRSSSVARPVGAWAARRRRSAATAPRLCSSSPPAMTSRRWGPT